MVDLLSILRAVETPEKNAIKCEKWRGKVARVAGLLSILSVKFLIAQEKMGGGKGVA